MREPRPDWSPLGVNFKILDEHPYLFHISIPPPPPPGFTTTFSRPEGGRINGVPSIFENLKQSNHGLNYLLSFLFFLQLNRENPSRMASTEHGVFISVNLDLVTQFNSSSVILTFLKHQHVQEKEQF